MSVDGGDESFAWEVGKVLTELGEENCSLLQAGRRFMWGKLELDE